MKHSSCLHSNTAEYNQRYVEQVIYDGLAGYGDEFAETAEMFVEEGYDEESARSCIADDIECRLRMVHDDLYENATPIQRLCIMDIDSMGLDYCALADGFLGDYEPKTVQSFNARPSAEGRGGIGRCRRSHGRCRP